MNDDADLIPAATVLLLRGGDHGPEVLMLRRNSKIAFGGMWVFPGGRVDDADMVDAATDDETGSDRAEDDVMRAARRAAVREVEEESGLDVAPGDLVTWSYWIPPPMPAMDRKVSARRFSTWFFVVAAPPGEVVIDNGEIHDFRWLTPADALDLHARKEIELVPPTWVTLTQLAQHRSVDAAMKAADGEPPEFRTKPVGKSPRMLMWRPDAGYDDGNPDRPGPRHRLVMASGGWDYLRTD